MVKKIKTKDLKVGDHVIIPATWLNHPFAKGHFDINSRDQIKEIIDSGFHEVKIDTSKGFSAVEVEKKGHGDTDAVPPQKWEPGKLVSPKLREAIHDRNISSEKRADVVYQSSVELMGKLLDDPRAENIQEAKEGIAEIVDMVFSQDDTSYHLLRITSHDFYTYTHSVNVGIFGIMLAKHFFKNTNVHNVHELGAGFFLHDLGKIRIDPAIINKPGKLTEEEMETMKTHPNQSYKMLKETNQLSEECGIIALQHHERQDGTGYPKGLKGDEIHIYGRVCCIADVYDALTAERSYKAKLTSFEALKLMKEKMIDHFQKDMFEKFVKLFTEKGLKRP
jgi:HD-GYP domain-containing protein (c-di-GMP phosphodiesterase class II)